MPREHQSEERLEVELPVCPEPGCRHVGKLPMKGGASGLKNYCRGPMQNPHKKRKMEPVRFVEAR